MDKKLAEFVSLLRNNGLRTSPPEVADAARAIYLTGYENRTLFQAALCSTLAKSQPDVLIFNRCFEQFFRFSALALPADNPPNSTPTSTPFFLGDGPAGGSGAGSGQGAGSEGRGNGAQSSAGVLPSALAEQLLGSAQNEDLAFTLATAINTAQLANIRVLTQKGLFARRILMAMGLEDFERELRELDSQHTMAAQNRAAVLRQKQQQLREQIRSTVDNYFQLARENYQEASISETNFALLRESKAAQIVIKRMAKKLITLHKRRAKKTARGVLDVRATLRGNQAYDGILINPHWRRVRKDQPRVMAICDVSRSVSQHARFLLLFLYKLII